MANENRRAASADPDVRMDAELEADPMLRLSEGKASPFQIALVCLAGIAIVAVVVWAMSQP